MAAGLNIRCKRCGMIHDRCRGHTKTGRPCAARPQKGCDVCRAHGAPKNITRQVVRHQEENKLRTVYERLCDPEPLGHPVAELLALAAEQREWMRVVRERVADLSEYGAEDVDRVEREKAVVLLYERAQDRAAKTLNDLARLDLDARMVRVSEAQAALVSTIVLTAIGNPYIGLTEEQQDNVRRALASGFRKAAQKAETAAAAIGRPEKVIDVEAG